MICTELQCFSLSLQKMENKSIIRYKTQTICKWTRFRILQQLHMAEIKIPTKIKPCYIFTNFQVTNGKCRNNQWMFNLKNTNPQIYFSHCRRYILTFYKRWEEPACVRSLHHNKVCVGIMFASGNKWWRSCSGLLYFSIYSGLID